MDPIEEHFKSLTQASTSETFDERAFSSWLNENAYQITPQPDDAHLPSNLVISAYDDRRRSQQSTIGPGLTDRLVENPQTQLLLPNLIDILKSTDSNDLVSEELLDLLGFETIDIVSDIVKNRSQALEELQGWQQMQENATAHSNDISTVAARDRIEAQLRANASRPLFTEQAGAAPEALPHVYTSASYVQNNVLSHLGTKYVLPIGTERRFTEEYEEVIVPPAKAVPMRRAERLIPVSELDPLAKGCFSAYYSLNRIQSIVFPCAYTSNENMLVCAPTGAGKTDVAMLTILRVISLYFSGSIGAKVDPASIQKNDFKIIYVAPMKALAAEIVRKFSKRLAWLSITVRELTGDMQMTKAEIAETQVIVTTPEKWDVVTRKPTGEGEVAAKVRLLIIDEVHLLNEDRGAVIETIVARTLRQVESTQSLIRIVGLSATLPNYVDVADFLRVSRQQGLFYFDSSFRPVPLEQHFIGIHGKANSPEARKNLDHATFSKVSELVQAGHQVMVFVHARKETVKAAQALKESATLEGTIDEFSCAEDPKWDFYRREISSSRNKEMKELFDAGFGIHHAGMLRSDRNLMEKLFLNRAIKVLCCTATLAWGVNLPAHAVLIKGTQVYDSSRGAFVDLSVLDVLQIFGRAGRPGLESEGEGFILTSEDNLTHYLDAVTAQHPIESKFVTGIIDSLNAEISLGTVANISEGVQWIGYTYLFVRMRRNPFVYGMSREEPLEDPALSSKRRELIISAARRLSAIGMIVLNETSESLTITERGRIGARYYIRHQTMETLNNELKVLMTEADILGTLANSDEFNQIQLRESELPELQYFMETIAPCEVKGGLHSKQGKVNILLQAYISQAYVEDFALVSDTHYVAQNGARILRAMLDIAVSEKWASTAAVAMGLSKAIEKKLWPFDNPLKQFDLSNELIYNLQRWADDYSPAQLATHSATDLGVMLHMNERHGAALLKAAKQFPTVSLDCNLRPLTSHLLRIDVRLGVIFDWNAKVHGGGEPAWLWIEDHNGQDILQMQHVYLRIDTKTSTTQFHIPVDGSHLPPCFRLRFVSDKWSGAENEVEINLDHIAMPPSPIPSSVLLDIPFLPLSAIPTPSVAQALGRRFGTFNAIQTQCFWSIVNLGCSSMLSGPGGCGKSTLGYVCLLKSLYSNKSRHDYAICVVPSFFSAKDAWSLLSDMAGDMKHSILLCRSPPSQDTSPDGKILIMTPSVLLESMDTAWLIRSLPNLRLAMLDSLHLIDAQYELAITMLRRAAGNHTLRLIAITSSLNDAASLTSWLQIPADAANIFRPNDRDFSLTITSQTFAVPYSRALFRSMSKPLYAAIHNSPPGDQTIVFVPSRSLCLSVAEDLLTQCALEENDRGFLGSDLGNSHLSLLDNLTDRTWIEPLSKGVGLYDRAMSRSDVTLTLRLYAEGVIRVIIVPRDTCWTVPVRGNVVVMGTEYIAAVKDGAEREIKQYGIKELCQMQSRAVRHGQPGRFQLFCPLESRNILMRLLEDGIPLESELLDSQPLREWLAKQRETGKMKTKQDLVDFLSSTFLRRRLELNPAFYDFDSSSDINLIISRAVDSLWDDGA